MPAPITTPLVNTQDTLQANEVSRAFVRQARQLLKTEYLPKLERCLTILSDEQIWWRAIQSQTVLVISAYISQATPDNELLVVWAGR